MRPAQMAPIRPPLLTRLIAGSRTYFSTVIFPVI
jgi:hypothetical protein